MSLFTLEIELLSDATFGAGIGVSGQVDTEVQHDDLGLPEISGRALKGLLVNECSEILSNLKPDKAKAWRHVAQRLYGQRGEQVPEIGRLIISSANCAPDLARALRTSRLPRRDVLESLTAIRRQTAINVAGAPDDETLRAVRVVIRGLKFYAPFSFYIQGEEKDKALLAACVMSLRRAGLSRGRGKGKIKARITDRPLEPEQFAATENTFVDLTETWFKPFRQDVLQ